MSTKVSMAVSALALFFAASPALATDLKGDPTSAEYVAPERISFSGFYIGGAIGYGNANHDLSVRDYFKEFCYDGDLATLKPFEDSNHGRPAKEWTLDAKNAFFTERGDETFVAAPSCEQLANEGRGPDVEAGDYATVPGDSREVASLDGLNSTGIVGDIRLGYDQQLGQRFVVGIFGSYGLSGMEADGAALGVGSFELERGDDWSVGARAGLLVNDRTLLYILAAYTQTEYELRATDGVNNFAKTTTFDGVTVGGGIEFAVTQNVFLGFEGTHTFYGSETIFDEYDAATNVGTSVEDDLGETKLLATLKLKLNSGLGF